MVSFLKTATLLVASASAALGFIPVTGVTSAGIGTRYEIRTLQAQYPDQFYLYLQALNVMYSLDSNNGTSYWAIAAIHGAPLNNPWDGITGNGGGMGYCPHSMNIFATWHRPYIALFEQQLVNSARAVALFYPAATRQRYIDAANKLRAPYYDWAIQPANGKNAWPEVMTQQTISVPTPAGQKTVNNPVYTYNLARQINDFGPPVSNWQRTLRYPSSSDSNAISADYKVTQTMNQNRDSLRSSLFQWFVNCQTYVEMNDDSVQNTSNNCGASLESVHNNVHVYIGGGANPSGHMTSPVIAAFDPAFMLHHANVDRYFALWQVVYPNAYITAQVTQSNTYVISKGTNLDGNSPLSPFRDSRGSWWTSNNVRSTTTFGYTYPEVTQSGGNSGNMKNILNSLYSSSATVRASKRSSLSSRQLINKIVPDNLKASNGSSFQYNANVQTSKYKLGGTFSIYFFLGQPTTTDTGSYSFDPNLAGTYNVLAGDMPNADVVSAHSVALTPLLLSKVQSGDLADLTPFTVGNYLQKSLSWKVVGPKGNEIDPATVPNFKVTVVQSTLTPIVNPMEFPTFSTFFPVKQATVGKPGGFSGNGLL